MIIIIIRVKKQRKTYQELETRHVSSPYPCCCLAAVADVAVGVVGAGVWCACRHSFSAARCRSLLFWWWPRFLHIHSSLTWSYQWRLQSPALTVRPRKQPLNTGCGVCRLWHRQQDPIGLLIKMYKR